MMEILIYVNPENYHAYRQLNAIRKFVPYPRRYASTHGAFKQLYAQCLSGETIVVFFVNDDADMAFLEVMEKDFVDTKLLVSIANGNEQWVARAYKQKPRIVTRSYDHPELLAMTIKGIARQMNGVN